MEEEKIFRNYIVSPKRGTYRESDKKSECIFCSVVKKLDRQLPVLIKTVPVITAFDHSFLVVNEYPYVPKGHVLIVTKRHIKNIDELNEKEIDEIFKVVIPRVKNALEKRNIYVRSASPRVLAEEADSAYKNVDVVVDVSHKVGIATKIARLIPLAVAKG